MSRTKTRGTILFAPVSTVLAHAGRCVRLAQELHRRGHEVIIAGAPRLLRDGPLSDASLRYEELPDVPVGEGLAILRSLWKIPDRRWLREHVRAEVRLLDRVRPDLVVVDFRLTMYVSARVRRVPIVSVVGGRWLYPYVATPYRAFRTAPAFWLRRLVGDRLSDRIIPRALRSLLRYKMRPYRRLFEEHGLEPPSDLWELLIGDVTVIVDSEVLAPTRPLPPNFVRVGPIYWEPEAPPPEWLSTWTAERPVIYVTLGSTGHPLLFSRLLEVLARLPVRAILTTGGQIHLAPEDIPPNVRVETFLPGRAVMERADVVICHGGAGTIYQAVAAGTPCLIVATHFEQELLGQEIEERGAGRLLALPEVLADRARLERTLEEMLENREAYRRAIQSVRRAHRGSASSTSSECGGELWLEGVKAAADAVEMLLASLVAPSRDRSVGRRAEAGAA